MSDRDDFEFYRHRPSPRDRREHATEQMSRLTFVPTTEAPAAPGIAEMNERELAAFYKRQDELFAADYVRIVGAPYPMSRILAAKLGYDVEHLPPARSYRAGDDVEAQSD